MSIAANAEFVLSYSCQIGEKPGAPQYSLEVTGTNFKVRKSIAMLSTREIEAKGSLSDQDLNELKKILETLTQPVRHESEKIAGHFILKAVVRGEAKNMTGSSSTSIPALNPLMAWIKAFHGKYPGISFIHPLAPGDSYQAAY